MQVKDFINKHKQAIIVFGGCTVVVIAWLVYIWITAPSTISVPKAERYEANANIEQQQAVTAETQANSIREQRIEARTDTARSKETLKERKARYEKTRNTANTVGVTNTNLDSRERQLQSDLERLYPVNR